MAMMNQMHLSLYRSLYRHAARIDKDLRRCLVLAPPKRVFSPEMGDVVRRPQDIHSSVYETVLQSFNQGGQFYRPGGVPQRPTMTGLLRELFKEQRIGSAVFSVEEIQDSSFDLLRHFSQVQNVAMQLNFEVPGEDAYLINESKKNKAKAKKEAAAKKKALKKDGTPCSTWSGSPIRPLHGQEAMSSGDILVSHPISMLDPDTKIFDRSVIMVVNGVSVGEAPDSGEEDEFGVSETELTGDKDTDGETVVLGLITNQPLDVRLGDLGPPNDEFTESVEVFSDCILYRGGPMMLDQAALSIVHTAGPDAVPESAQIGDHDLWLSANWAGASEAVLTGKCTVDQFRFFLGFCLWEEKHLGVDIERHSWFPMSVNTSQLKSILGIDGQKLPITEETIANRWSTVVRACGDEQFAAMASFPAETPSDAAELVQQFTDGLMGSSFTANGSMEFSDLDN